MMLTLLGMALQRSTLGVMFYTYMSSLLGSFFNKVLCMTRMPGRLAASLRDTYVDSAGYDPA